MLLKITLNAVINLAGPTDVVTVSDNNKLVITPAGYTFSIWGLIYVLSFVIRILMILKCLGTISFNVGLTMVSTTFLIISDILNPIWLLYWTEQKVFRSAIVLTLLTIMLGFSYCFSDIYRPYISLGQIFVAIYLGWCVVAGLLNWLIFGRYYLLNLFGITPTPNYKKFFDIISIPFIFICVLTSMYCFSYYDTNGFTTFAFTTLAYVGVQIWALIGVIVGLSQSIGMIGN